MCVLTLIEILNVVMVNVLVASIDLCPNQAAVQESGKSQLSVW